MNEELPVSDDAPFQYATYVEVPEPVTPVPAGVAQLPSARRKLLVPPPDDGTTPPGLGDETVVQKDERVHTYGWYMSRMATDAREKGAHR